jgi:hypothetical protein
MVAPVAVALSVRKRERERERNVISIWRFVWCMV